VRFYFPCLIIVCAASDHAPLPLHTVSYGGRGCIRSSLLCLTSLRLSSKRFSLRSPPRCFIAGDRCVSHGVHLRNLRRLLIRSPQCSSPKAIVGYRKYIKLSFFPKDIPRTHLVNELLEVRFLKRDYESRTACVCSADLQDLGVQPMTPKVCD